jgi:hypothetical protein
MLALMSIHVTVKAGWTTHRADLHIAEAAFRLDGTAAGIFPKIIHQQLPRERISIEERRADLL